MLLYQKGKPPFKPPKGGTINDLIDLIEKVGV